MPEDTKPAPEKPTGIVLNLHSAARYIHGTSPALLAGLYEAVHLKCKALGLGAWRPVAAENTGEQATGSIRGILSFVESVHADSDKTTKRNLQQIYATLQTRSQTSGYKFPAAAEDEKSAADKAKFDAAVKAEVDKQVAAKTAPKPVAPAAVKPATPPAPPVPPKK